MAKIETINWSDHISIGIESEALRVLKNGNLALSKHPFPLELGFYAKDFSESQLEIITNPHKNIDDLISQLRKLYQNAEGAIGDELLWPFSMPPLLPCDKKIPIAVFDNTEEGHWEYFYRTGLANRYGKKRQMISGIHLNISLSHEFLKILARKKKQSFQEFINQTYLRAAKNYYRYMALLVFLTGASPVAADNYNSVSEYQKSKNPILSLRNSTQGYAGNFPVSFIDISSVESYISGLKEGLNRIHPYFKNLGLISNGELIQLSDRVFQSEKEFYAPIRLKQIKRGAETQIQALEKRGVKYLELRFFDKNPFFKGGVDPDILYLIQLIFMQSIELSEQSVDVPKMINQAVTTAELSLKEVEDNTYKVINMIDLFKSQLVSFFPLARSVKHITNNYEKALLRYFEMLENPSEIPSLRIYNEFSEKNIDWTEFALEFMGKTNFSYSGVSYAV